MNKFEFPGVDKVTMKILDCENVLSGGKRNRCVVLPANVPIVADSLKRKNQNWIARASSANDLIIQVGDSSFHLHKLAMVSRSEYLNRLVFKRRSNNIEDNNHTIQIQNLPGGRKTFELVVKFCYGWKFDMTSSNIASLYCAANFLEMSEDIEQGNLISKTESFLTFLMLSSWKDTFRILKSCESISHWAKELQLVKRCSEAIAWKACAIPKLEIKVDACWWFEDVSLLRIDHFIEAIQSVKKRGMKSEFVGSCIENWTKKWFSKVTLGIDPNVTQKHMAIQLHKVSTECLIKMLPTEENSVSCNFLLHLLKAGMMLKLTAMNKLLMEENDRLQKQVSHLVYENGYFRQNTQNATKDTSCDSVVTSGQHNMTSQHPPRDASPAGLLSIAEETLAEFLSKATGTAVEWVQMPGMKPGPDSIGIVAISHGCTGVAARACGLVGLEPTRVAEILKDRPLWFRDCRAVDIVNVLPTANGGTIELLYMQLYAPTTLAPARDFWLLRYTSVVEDGSLVICERSLKNTQNGPSMPPVPHFVRADMLPSGYLIRPCEGGGSIIHIVDHMDLEPWSVPEVLRPLYESPMVLAQKTTMAALRHLRQISHEVSQPNVTGWGRRPAALRALSQRLSRGFNEALNGFTDEGWTMMGNDGVDDVTILVNSSPDKLMGLNLSFGNGFPSVSNAVLCAKASMLLQNVPPAILLRFLREHRSEWADHNMDAYTAAAIKVGPCSLTGSRVGNYGGQVILPLAHTIEHEEFLEVIKLDGVAHSPEEMMGRELFLLQLCSGMDENAIGTCAELIFAPIDASFADDAPLLPSGFRIIPLESGKESSSPNRTLDLASALDIGPTGNRASSDNAGNSGCVRSVMTIAFEFAYESHMQENVACMARQYVRSIISSVQRVALALSPSNLSSHAGLRSPLGTPEAQTLAHWICNSYRCYLGVELLKSNTEGKESVLKSLWHHSDAVLCCTLKAMPVFTFSNQAGLDMLETTLVALQDISLEKIFDDNGRKTLFSEFPQIIQQGFACLQGGICLSSMGRPVSFERAVAWKVLNDEQNAHCICFMFVNWSFV